MQRSGVILIADDEQNDVSLISYALKSAGVINPIRWLRDGEMVMRYLKKHEPEHVIRDPRQIPLLLVIDWNMPRTNTERVLKWIREQPEYINLLIVVLTGSDSPDEKKKAYAAGANWHLVKSAQLKDLAQLVQSVKDFWSHVVEPPQVPSM